jgi:hypothetical protein
VAERQQVADWLPELNVQQANVEAQPAHIAAGAGAALCLAKLFPVERYRGDDAVITALLVLAIDPLAVLLTLAPTPIHR